MLFSEGNLNLTYIINNSFKFPEFQLDALFEETSFWQRAYMLLFQQKVNFSSLIS